MLRIHRHGLVICVQGTLRDNRAHAHHAMQLAWSAPEPLALTVDGGARRGAFAVVDGGVTHSLKLPDGELLLIERHSLLARRVREAWLAGESWRVTDEGPPRLHDPSGLEAHLPSMPAAPMDPRVADVLRWLDACEARRRWSEVTTEAALRRVHLSIGRFRHLFSEALATPWRSYVVWRRAVVALQLAANGEGSLTEVAHQAGYADSAHFSRQFVALFGLPPSAVLHNSRFVQGEARRSI